MVLYRVVDTAALKKGIKVPAHLKCIKRELSRQTQMCVRSIPLSKAMALKLQTNRGFENCRADRGVIYLVN